MGRFEHWWRHMGRKVEVKTMGNAMKKWRDGEEALDSERRLMKEAMARLGEVKTGQAGGCCAARLIFGLDLTGSREASLSQARVATAGMFDAIKLVGKVAVKLIYYRGTSECRASDWCDDPGILCRSMLGLSCETGESQIARLLQAVLAEKEKISAVVFVGDHCEEDFRKLETLAQALGHRSIPIFVFHECADQDERSLLAKPVFRRMAEISGGVYVEFKPDSGEVLREMLSSVAAFSAAGADGFERMALPATAEARQLRTRLLLGSGKPG